MGKIKKTENFPLRYPYKHLYEAPKKMKLKKKFPENLGISPPKVKNPFARKPTPSLRNRCFKISRFLHPPKNLH